MTIKLETQKDRWQALLDGYEIQNSKGTRYKFINNNLFQRSKMDDDFTMPEMSLLGDVLKWQLYEPPTKPENKVIVIAHNELADGADEDYYKIDALCDTYDTENDAIRAAMEWIGEKAKKVVIDNPTWMNTIDRIYKTEGGQLRPYDVLWLEKALLMRWPIEVLEEV